MQINGKTSGFETLFGIYWCKKCYFHQIFEYTN